METLAIPPLEYLFECSMNSLQELELAAMNRSARCMKAAKSEWQEALAQRECAGVARWLIENREEVLAMARRTLETQEVLVFPEKKRA